MTLLQVKTATVKAAAAAEKLSFSIQHAVST